MSAPHRRRVERWLKRVLESSEDRADQSCLEEEEEEEPKHIFKTYELGGEDGAGGGGRRSVVLLEEGRDPMGGGEEGTTGLVGKKIIYPITAFPHFLPAARAVRSSNVQICCWSGGMFRSGEAKRPQNDLIAQSHSNNIGRSWNFKNPDPKKIIHVTNQFQEKYQKRFKLQI